MNFISHFDYRIPTQSYIPEYYRRITKEPKLERFNPGDIVECIDVTTDFVVPNSMSGNGRASWRKAFRVGSRYTVSSCQDVSLLYLKGMSYGHSVQAFKLIATGLPPQKPNSKFKVGDLVIFKSISSPNIKFFRQPTLPIKVFSIPTQEGRLVCKDPVDGKTWQVDCEEVVHAVETPLSPPTLSPIVGKVSPFIKNCWYSVPFIPHIAAVFIVDTYLATEDYVSYSKLVYSKVKMEDTGKIVDCYGRISEPRREDQMMYLGTEMISGKDVGATMGASLRDTRYYSSPTDYSRAYGGGNSIDFPNAVPKKGYANIKAIESITTPLRIKNKNKKHKL